MPAFNNVQNFACIGWTKQDLLNSWTIPAMSAKKDRNIKYREFISSPPHVVDGEPEWSDPRVSAQGWPVTIPFSQEEAGIALELNGKRLLVDGYCRSLIFIRDAKETDRFAVWSPA